MALIRCTCIYRPATADERAAGRAALTVEIRDPFCPAGHVHDRANATSRSATGKPDRR